MRIDSFGHRGVATWLAGNDQVQGDGFMSMGQLISPDGQDPEHRPKDMGNRQSLREVSVGKKYADATSLGSKWIGCCLG